MAGLDPNMKQEGMEGKPQDRDIEGADLKIAVALGKKTLKEAGGLDAIKKGLGSSSDPVQVVSKFLVQLIMKIKDSLEAQQIELSPSIVLAKGGWVVQMIDFIETELKLPAEFSDQVLGDVMETFKAMEHSPDQQAPQGEQAAPPQVALTAGPPQPPMQGA